MAGRDKRKQGIFIYTMKQRILYWAFMMLAFTGLVNAQRYDANWTFGGRGGIHFDTLGNAIPFQSNCYDAEMSACMSDAEGRLLFNTTRFESSAIVPNSQLSNIKDVNDNIIANGDSIEAYISSTSGAIIFPSNDNSKYLIFHLGNISGTTCFNGSFCPKLFLTVVSANNNSIVVTKKNHLVSNESFYEKISAVKHANGKDWWLLTQTQVYDSVVNQRSRFYRFLIQDTLVIDSFYQDIGIATNSLIDFAGQMQISNAGNKLGLVRSESRYFEVYDFDRCTGLLALRKSEKLIDTNFLNATELYGAEFSLNESFFYISSGWQGGTNKIYQVNLNNNSLQPILISTPSSYLGQLQLATDGKIYLANSYSNGSSSSTNNTYNQYNQNLSVINQPDSAGLACNFQPFSFFLGDSSKSSMGLPNFPNYRLGALSIYEADAGNDTIICTDDTLQQTKVVPLGTPAVNGVSYQWFPNYNLSSDTTAEVLAYPDSSTLYYLMLTDSTIINACKSRLDSVYVEVKACNVGIDEQLTGNNIKIYPNPTTQTIMIQIENVQSSIKGVMMFDVTGKIVHSQQSAVHSKMISFNISAVANGLYFLHIEMSNGQRVVRKVVKE